MDRLGRFFTAGAILAGMVLFPPDMADATAGAHAPGEPIARWMPGAEVRSTFAGKTIQGHYASGTAFTETYHGDGGIDYVERRRQFGGHWSIQGNALCTIYHKDGTGGCYLVSQVGENCYEFYYVARTEFDAANARLMPPSWTARAAVADRSGSCEERPAV